jgi:hypothetical protein
LTRGRHSGDRPIRGGEGELWHLFQVNDVSVYVWQDADPGGTRRDLMGLCRLDVFTWTAKGRGLLHYIFNNNTWITEGNLGGDLSGLPKWRVIAWAASQCLRIRGMGTWHRMRMKRNGHPGGF